MPPCVPTKNHVDYFVAGSNRDDSFSCVRYILHIYATPCASGGNLIAQRGCHHRRIVKAARRYHRATVAMPPIARRCHLWGNKLAFTVLPRIQFPNGAASWAGEPSPGAHASREVRALCSGSYLTSLSITTIRGYWTGFLLFFFQAPNSTALIHRRRQQRDMSSRIPGPRSILDVAFVMEHSPCALTVLCSAVLCCADFRTR